MNALERFLPKQRLTSQPSSWPSGAGLLETGAHVPGREKPPFRLTVMG